MARARLSTASDAELLTLASTDPQAFGVFYDRFEAELLGFLYRATGRADIAADLTAEVFAGALQSAPGFDPRLGSARAWLFGIARHELSDTWRRGRVEDRARRSLEIEALVLSDAALERIETELGWCPGTYHLSISVMANPGARPHKPFGTATFTVHP